MILGEQHANLGSSRSPPCARRRRAGAAQEHRRALAGRRFDLQRRAAQARRARACRRCRCRARRCRRPPRSKPTPSSSITSTTAPSRRSSTTSTRDGVRVLGDVVQRLLRDAIERQLRVRATAGRDSTPVAAELGRDADGARTTPHEARQRRARPRSSSTAGRSSQARKSRSASICLGDRQRRASSRDRPRRLRGALAASARAPGAARSAAGRADRAGRGRCARARPPARSPPCAAASMTCSCGRAARATSSCSSLRPLVDALLERRRARCAARRRPARCAVRSRAIFANPSASSAPSRRRHAAAVEPAAVLAHVVALVGGAALAPGLRQLLRRARRCARSSGVNRTRRCRPMISSAGVAEHPLGAGVPASRSTPVVGHREDRVVERAVDQQAQAFLARAQLALGRRAASVMSWNVSTTPSMRSSMVRYGQHAHQVPAPVVGLAPRARSVCSALEHAPHVGVQVGRSAACW